MKGVWVVRVCVCICSRLRWKYCQGDYTNNMLPVITLADSKENRVGAHRINPPCLFIISLNLSADSEEECVKVHANHSVGVTSVRASEERVEPRTWDSFQKGDSSQCPRLLSKTCS